ncbi:hypothetical protein [Streptomyces fulvorobeus]|uniref:Uncharacterized protein n=1 Tax=Streptomyces fulvorobeus TaxID=284028 RepID=A0A7Y9KVQ7_9ACTN|nr:hypothetical protein [Streptomyces fulvorobeus]NYE39118.1 hypothetical protein [Streptomyces fulvorobeus]
MQAPKGRATGPSLVIGGYVLLDLGHRRQQVPGEGHLGRMATASVHAPSER